jgi:predicted nucleotidyltransferase
MKWPEFSRFDLPKSCALLAQVGSHSHGTYIPPKDGGIDDIDIMGLVVPPASYYLGLDKFEHLCTWVDEYDITLYEAKKFMGLLLKNNPNVIGLLWLDENMYKIRTPEGQMLIDNRDIFSSKLSYKSFTGYAYSQLRKMEPGEYKGFMGAKRKELVDKFGYDTKNAAHLIRLLRMGMEFMTTGELNVMRHDSGQLIDIKRGLYTFEEIQALAKSLFSKAEDAFIHSKLPNQPDYKRANELLQNIIESKIKLK